MLKGKGKPKKDEKSERGTRKSERETGAEASGEVAAGAEDDVSADVGPVPGSAARMPWIVMDNEVSRVGDSELTSAWDDLQEAMGWK